MSHLDPQNFVVVAHRRDIRAVHVTHATHNVPFLGGIVAVPVSSAIPMRLQTQLIAADLVTDHEINGEPGKLLVAKTEMGDALFFIPNSQLWGLGNDPQAWVDYACRSETPWGLTVAFYVGKSPRDL